MNLRATALCMLILLPLYGIATPFQAPLTWHGAPGSSEGESWSVQIITSNASGTHLILECPGFWTQAVQQDGETRTKVILPESGVLTEVGLPVMPAIARLLAIPDDKDPVVVIHNVEYQTVACDNPYLAEPIEGSAILESSQVEIEDIYPLNWAEVNPPGILKDYRVAQVDISPVRYDAINQELMLATRLEIEIKTQQPSTVNLKTHHARPSEAFQPLYESLIDNLDEFNTAVPLVGEGPRGGYLIIVDDLTYGSALDDMIEILAEWKRELGYQVTIKHLSLIGSSREAIKEAVMEQYYGADTALDYLLLIGDISGQITVPAYSIVKPGGGEQDVSDHPYTMLEGLDYFPDIMVGRISVNSDYELITAISKTKAYQQSPDAVGSTDWLTEALVVAGNYSDTGIAPITPVWTSLWLVDKLYDYGYLQVDTVFYWAPDPTYPGTDLIADALNDGVGLVGYRGWADANGWQYPVFAVDDVDNLSNGSKTPVVVSMVCNTGDFGNASVNPCFGEAWLRAGTPVNYIGGVAFFGPSDLHTNTKWNNALYAGFFEGLLEENLYRIGQSSLRSKFELYYGFPENTGTGDFAEFYFHVYNILGDPELAIWTMIPSEIELDVADQLLPGKQQVTATVTNASGAPLGGAYVAFYKQDEVLAGGVTGSDGTVKVEIQPLTEGELKVTVSKQNCIPEQAVIDISVNDFPVGIADVSVDGDGVVSAGESVDLTVKLHNYGSSDLTGVTADLTESDDFVSISASTASVGTVSASGDADADFTFSVMPHCPEGHVIELTLALSDDALHNSEIKFIVPVGGMFFMPAGIIVQSGDLNPGSSAELLLQIYNAGTLSANQPTGTLSCSDGAVTITANVSAFPIVPPDGIGVSSAPYSINIDADAAVGRQVILDLEIDAGDSYVQNVNFTMQFGEQTSTDPLGPDSYGYYAYDDTDVNYAEAPSFNWVELDPEYSGSGGDLHQLGDDKSTVVELPFTFSYYGGEYDTITICSNGWISMGSTWMANFRNWNMPSALGPPSLISPFWDDLKADTTGGNSSIDVYTDYDDAGGRFIIEWSRTINRYQYETYANWKEETFEIILYDPAEHPTSTGDGEILFQYLAVQDVDDNNNYATVGIEDEAHIRGLEYAYANHYPDACAPLENERAIKFTTDPPDAFGDGSMGQGGVFDKLELFAPVPNPANPSALLNFQLPHGGYVDLAIYNTLGQKVVSLVNGQLAAGRHTVTVRGDYLASGIYFALLRFGEQSVAQKVLLLK